MCPSVGRLVPSALAPCTCLLACLAGWPIGCCVCVCKLPDACLASWLVGWLCIVFGLSALMVFGHCMFIGALPVLACLLRSFMCVCLLCTTMQCMHVRSLTHSLTHSLRPRELLCVKKKQQQQEKKRGGECWSLGLHARCPALPCPACLPVCRSAGLEG